MQPRYAQESHTHSGFVGGVGEGWSGIVCSAHANAGGSLVANGFTITTTGTTTSVTETLSLSGSTIEKYPRAAVRNSGNFAGHYCSVGTKYLNTLRGSICVSFLGRWPIRLLTRCLVGCSRLLLLPL